MLVRATNTGRFLALFEAFTNTGERPRRGLTAVPICNTLAAYFDASRTPAPATPTAGRTSKGPTLQPKRKGRARKRASPKSAVLLVVRQGVVSFERLGGWT